VGEQKRKEKKKETHPRGQSLGLGFIPSKNPKGDVLDGALVGVHLNATGNSIVNSHSQEEVTI